MKIMKPLLCSAVAVSLLAACISEDSTSKKNNRIVINEKAMSSGQAAEAFAEAGEQLVNPIHFMQANVLFDRALQLDKNNIRAKFYKAYIASMMVNRGILKRIDPLVKTLSAEEQANYADFLNKFPQTAIRQFLLDNQGKSDIKDEKGVQQYLDDVRSAQNEFRLFAKNNKNINLTLHGNIITGSITLSRMAEICDANDYMNGDYSDWDGWLIFNKYSRIKYNDDGTTEVSLPECNMLEAAEITLDRADMEAIQHIQSAAVIYHTLATAYDISGLIDFGKKFEHSEATAEDVFDFLNSHAEAGKLRTSNKLKDVLEMGSDLVAGVRYIVKGQGQEFCKNGKGNEDLNARSKNLVKNDICVDKTAEHNGELMPVEDLIKQVESALAGNTQLVKLKNNQGEVVETDYNPAKVLTSPIKDLRAVLPNKFNKCGSGLALPDKTVGGVFPRGDGEQFVLSSNEWDYCDYDGSSY